MPPQKLPKHSDLDLSILRPKIAVWGATKVGKTAYLAGALLAIDRFSKYSDWNWYTSGDEADKAHKFFKTAIAKLDAGFMPPPTEEGEPQHYTFHIRRKDKFWSGITGRYHEISLVEAAGSLIEYETDNFGYFDTLRGCQGVLLMIDPTLKAELGSAIPENSASNQSYLELVEELIRRLHKTRRQGERLDIPTAVCLTKIDQPRHWPHRKKPESYTKEIIRENAFNRINKSFKKLAYFSISVVGRYRNPHTGEECPNINENGTQMLDATDWKPYRILDPMFWLFDQIEADRDRRLPWWRRELRQWVRKPNYIPPKKADL